MPSSEDPADLTAKMLEEFRAAEAAGREFAEDDILELFFRHGRSEGLKGVTLEEVRAAVAPFRDDARRLVVETAAALKDGFRNPGFKDELLRRVKALFDARPDYDAPA